MQPATAGGGGGSVYASTPLTQPDASAAGGGNTTSFYAAAPLTQAPAGGSEAHGAPVYAVPADYGAPVDDEAPVGYEVPVDDETSADYASADGSAQVCCRGRSLRRGTPPC